MYKSPESIKGPEVSYLGPRGTYSEEAVLKYFGSGVELSPTTTMGGALSSVEKGQTEYAVVPLRNSSVKYLVEDTDLLLAKTELNIVGEEILPVRHAVLVPKGVSLDDVRTVYGHEQAIAQCRQSLSESLPEAEITLSSSNTAAVDKVLRRDDAAIIASSKVARITPLKIALRDVQDRADNHTRFVVLAQHSTQPSGKDKTSIICRPEDRAGGLYSMIGPLADRGIPMDEIHSRENSEGGHSMYIEIEGHIDEDPVAQAIEEMGRRAANIKILGSYPVAELLQWR